MDSRYLPAATLAVVNSLIQLLGVLVWDWPIGNVFLLLWVENVLITIVAIGRVLSVRPEPGTSLTSSKVSTSFSLAFFTLIHGAFSFVLAFVTGLDLGAMWFTLPLIVLAVRYVVEALGTFSRVEAPRTVAQAHGFAMGRILMLHVAIIACWGVVIVGLTDRDSPLASLPLSLPQLALVVLLIIKTVAEVMSLGRDPNRESSWKFTAR